MLLLKKYGGLPIIVLLICGCLLNVSCGDPAKKPQQNKVDMAKHPIYSQYDFVASDKTIYLGTQPLYTPTGLITETMKHDVILKRELSKLGVRLKSYPFLKGSDVNYYFRKGKLDVGIGGDMPALSLASTENIIIPALIQSGATSLVTKESMLLNGLKGKRIAYAFGSNAHFMLLNSLSLAGLSEKDVTLIPLDVMDMPAAMARDEINAFAAWEPVVQLSVKEYGFFAEFKKISTGYIYFSQSFFKTQPEAACHILAAEIRAIGWLKRSHENLLRASQWNLDAIQVLLGKPISLTGEENAKLATNDILGRYSILYYGIPKKDLKPGSALFEEFDFLKKIDKIPHHIPWEKVVGCFDQEMMEKVLENPTRYPREQFDYESSPSGV
ncbi:MAG: ABC transporter substrate-binding protein [bacterium]|nr:ABC transporter substrate-binding protein [bacterium]